MLLRKKQAIVLAISSLMLTLGVPGSSRQSVAHQPVGSIELYDDYDQEGDHGGVRYGSCPERETFDLFPFLDEEVSSYSNRPLPGCRVVLHDESPDNFSLLSGDHNLPSWYNDRATFVSIEPSR